MIIVDDNYLWCRALLSRLNGLIIRNKRKKFCPTPEKVVRAPHPYIPGSVAVKKDLVTEDPMWRDGVQQTDQRVVSILSLATIARWAITGHFALNGNRPPDRSQAMLTAGETVWYSIAELWVPIQCHGTSYARSWPWLCTLYVSLTLTLAYVTSFIQPNYQLLTLSVFATFIPSVC